MRTVLRTLVVLAAGALLSALGASPAAAVHDCAFQDVNDNGVLDPGEPVVLSSDWIGKTYVSPHPFVVPKACDHSFLISVGKTHLKATKITFDGRLEVFKPNGSPVILEANPDAILPPASPNKGDGSVTFSPGSRISTGGQSGQALFPDHVDENAAIHNRTITVVARGRTDGPADQLGPGVCAFTGAALQTQYPLGNNDIGVLCNGDMIVRASLFQAARINLQSWTGTIDAHATGLGELTAGAACDDPIKNLTGNGNNNGVVDDPDYPCDLDMGALFDTKHFANVGEMQSFCGVALGPSVFEAFNDPLIMIAGTNLDLRGAASATGTGDNRLSGRYRVTLASIHGDVLMQNTRIDHVASLPTPGGAIITLASRPTSANRKDNDAEDFFGPFTGGIYNIDSACLTPPFPIQYGDAAATVLGTPDPAPCAQYPTNFKAMKDVIHKP